MFKFCPCCGVDLTVIEQAVKNASGSNVVKNESMEMVRGSDERAAGRFPKWTASKSIPLPTIKKKHERRGKISAADASKILGISQSRLCRMRKNGSGPAFKEHEGRFWYRREDLRDFKRSKNERSKIESIIEDNKNAFEVTEKDF